MDQGLFLNFLGLSKFHCMFCQQESEIPFQGSVCSHSIPLQKDTAVKFLLRNN